jgi:hypothetical protein
MTVSEGGKNKTYAYMSTCPKEGTENIGALGTGTWWKTYGNCFSP